MIVAGTVVAQGRDGSDGTHRESTAQRVPPTVADRVPVLETAKTPSDELPAELSVSLSAPRDPGGPTMYPMEARRAIALDGKASIYLIPTSDGVCVAYVNQEAVSPNCATAAQIEAGEPVYATVYTECTSVGPPPATCGKQFVYGIAPRGAAAAEVRLAGGESVAARVSRNAFVIGLDPAAELSGVTLSD
jgi:hypothetical protein